MSRHHRASIRRLAPAHYLALVPTAALFVLGVAACGADDTDIALPIFEGGPGVASNAEGGDATNEDGAANEASTRDGANETSTNDGATGDGSTTETSLVISQAQSRGTGGGNDEFIEIYNPTGATITFDATWTITVRNATGGMAGCAAELPAVVYTGANQAILSHKHLLITASSYSESVTGDDTFAAGIADAASIVLLHAAAAADALCFSYDPTTTSTLETCTAAYTCEGTPASNLPHDNTSSLTSNVDTSLERKPGGTGGNGIDANDNATDFATNAAADPHDLASAAVP